MLMIGIIFMFIDIINIIIDIIDSKQIIFCSLVHFDQKKNIKGKLWRNSLVGISCRTQYMIPPPFFVTCMILFS